MTDPTPSYTSSRVPFTSNTTSTSASKLNDIMASLSTLPHKTPIPTTSAPSTTRPSVTVPTSSSSTAYPSSISSRLSLGGVGATSASTSTGGGLSTAHLRPTPLSPASSITARRSAAASTVAPSVTAAAPAAVAPVASASSTSSVTSSSTAPSITSSSSSDLDELDPRPAPTAYSNLPRSYSHLTSRLSTGGGGGSGMANKSALPHSQSSAIPSKSSSHSVNPSTPITPDWSQSRGGSISTKPPGSNFLPVDNFLHDAKSLGKFNSWPREEQERELVKDLSYVLVGIEGTYIRMANNVNEQHEDERVQFVVNPFITDKSLVETCQLMIPIAEAYFAIQTYIQVHSRWEFGLVTHAFSAAAREILKGHLVLIAQLETQFELGQLTLFRDWYYLQPALLCLSALDLACRRLHRSTGGAFLNILSGLIDESGDEGTRKLYQHLLIQSSVPYLDMLNSWLTQGVINDTYDEFQIKQHIERKKENVRRDFNDMYWDARYTIRTEKVPKFLASDPYQLAKLSEKILTTGKYLNVIRECGRSIPKSSQLTSTPPALTYALNADNDRAYFDWIDASYKFASQLVLDLLLNENDLLGRLRSIKRYFLGSQGDFFIHFMDVASTELAANTKDILLPKLNSHLDSALRTSRASQDPYGGDLSCSIQSFTLVQQLELIHNISANKLGQVDQKPKLNNLLKGHETIEFNYQVRWPLSLILSKKTLTKYQLLFRHLFAIKHVEHSLNQCWATHQSLKELQLDRKYHFSFGLRQRMLHFFHNMSYYIMIEVLEPNWHELEVGLKSAPTVDDVLRLHSTFLDTCLKQCLLTHQTLLKTINKLSITALFYAQHADTSINSHIPDINYDDSDDDQLTDEAAEIARQRRQASLDEDGLISRKKPMSLKHRQKYIADSTYATKQSIEDSEHQHFIRTNAARFDQLLFEFLSTLRTKSAFHSSDAHFTNLYNRLDYNDWYARRFQEQQQQQQAGTTTNHKSY